MAQLTPMRPTYVRSGPAKRPPKPRESLWKSTGRAWINGAEVGGPDPRFAHLNRSYD